jgi:FkbM family methyltransferase
MADSEARTERLDYAAADIRLHVTSDMERKYRVKSCAKEPWTVQWLDTDVRPGQVLYDIGANVGTFTLVAAVGRQATVVAFEPGFANFARLCENIHLNSAGHAVLPVPLPLVEHTGIVGFHYRSTEPGQSRHKVSSNGWRTTPTASGRYEQPMLGVSLDEARRLFELPAPDHIKLDVDGAELGVLAGATETLRATSLLTVLAEVESALRPEVDRLLAAAGLAVDVNIARDLANAGAPGYVLYRRP